MHRNSRLLLSLNSYQIRHAEIAWGILATSSCGCGGGMLYPPLPDECSKWQKTVEKETLGQT